MKKIFGFTFVLTTFLLVGFSATAQLNAYRRVPSNENVTFVSPSVSPAISSSRQTLYSYAHKGQYKNLKQFLSEGNDIEALDYNGNTPLCEAVWRRDKLAVHTLIFAGANTSADCVHRIPQIYRNLVEFPVVKEDFSTHPAMITSGQKIKLSDLAVGAAVLGGLGVGMVAIDGGSTYSKEELIANCETQAGGKCTKCNSGYVVGSDGQCYDEIQNCKTQKNDICTACVSGYVVSSDKFSCYAEIQNCVTQVDDTCSACKDGFVASTDAKTCYAKIEHCKTQKDSVCEVCETRYKLENDKCVEMAEGSCTTEADCGSDMPYCIEGMCRACQTPGEVCVEGESYCSLEYKCETCNTTFMEWHENACQCRTVKPKENEACTEECGCTEGSSCKNAKCVRDSTIPNCDIEEDGKCTQCKAGYHLGTGSQCYADITNCTAYNDDKCTTCAENFVLSTTQTRCYAKIEGCLAQVDEVCTKCDRSHGYILYETKCYNSNQRGSGIYKNAGDNTLDKLEYTIYFNDSDDTIETSKLSKQDEEGVYFCQCPELTNCQTYKKPYEYYEYRCSDGETALCPVLEIDTSKAGCSSETITCACPEPTSCEKDTGRTYTFVCNDKTEKTCPVYEVDTSKPGCSAKEGLVTFETGVLRGRALYSAEGAVFVNKGKTLTVNGNLSTNDKLTGYAIGVFGNFADIYNWNENGKTGTINLNNIGIHAWKSSVNEHRNSTIPTAGVLLLSSGNFYNEGNISVTADSSVDFSNGSTEEDTQDLSNITRFTNSLRDNYIAGTVLWGVYGRENFSKIVGYNETTGKINVSKGTGVTLLNADFTNKGEITVGNGIGVTIGTDTAITSQGNRSTLINLGSITVNGKLDKGSVNYSGTGILANNANVINRGDITVKDGYGIYAKDSLIENYKNITVTGTKNAIYATGNSTVYNKGTLKVNSIVSTGNKNDGTYIKLEGGAAIVNEGIYTSNAPINFDEIKYTALKGSTTISDKALLGTANIGSNVVQNGFKTAYIEPNMFDAPDTSELKVTSESALFNANLADNGSDVVMTKKDFNELTENKSLAKFLEQNYALENNEAFYNELKAIDSTSAFKSGLNSLTGMDTLGRFAYEDLTAVREMNLAMNNQMFANDDKNIFTTQGSVNNFSFKNGEASSGQFALGNRKVSPNLRVGYAMSVTRVNTNDEANDNTRHSTIFQMALPFNYNTKGLKMISTPMAGFARGHYNRNGFNDMTYDGIIEKRMFGLMNEMRYPFKVAGFKLSPTVELNAIAYNQKGGEENKPYSLTIQSDNNLSVEAGVGMYATKDYTFGKDAKLNLNAGLMLYREFADPYNMKLGMQGMSGSFDLYDDNHSDYRGVASFGLDYKAEDLDIYGAVQHYMEDESHTNVKSGVKLKF